MIFSPLVYAFTVQLKSLTVLLSCHSQGGLFCPTEAAVSKTTACISRTYYQGKLNLIESNDCPARCH
jgi:hypothetical protein